MFAGLSFNILIFQLTIHVLGVRARLPASTLSLCRKDDDSRTKYEEEKAMIINKWPFQFEIVTVNRTYQMWKEKSDYSSVWLRF